MGRVRSFGLLRAMATKINKFIFFIYLRVVENGDAKKDCIVCFWVYLFYFYILIVLWPCETHSMLLFFISVFFFVCLFSQRFSLAVLVDCHSAPICAPLKAAMHGERFSQPMEIPIQISFEHLFGFCGNCHGLKSNANERHIYVVRMFSFRRTINKYIIWSLNTQF